MQHSGYAPTDFVWDHNTLITIPDGIATAYPWDAAATFWEPTSPQKLNKYSIKNSIMGYDFQGDGGSCGTVFSANFTNTTVDRIANPNAGCMAYSNVGATNTFTNWSSQSGNAGVGFVNLSGGDYHLAPTSPYSASCASGCGFTSSDGTDVGADIDLVNMATSGAIAGTPTWDQQAGLVLTPGSTKLVFRYEAPTTAACTAAVYRAPARIAGNQVASIADSAASSISDVLHRQIYVSGLAASTHYWYKLACGGVLMVGDFFTRPAGSGTYIFTFDWSAPTAMRYSSSAAMSSPITLSAATHQSIPVASDSVVYAQVGTTGPITILIAP